MSNWSKYDDMGFDKHAGDMGGGFMTILAIIGGLIIWFH